MQYCTSEQKLSFSRLDVGGSEVLVDEDPGSGGWLCKLLKRDVVEAVAVAADAERFGVAVLKDLVLLRCCARSLKRAAVVLAKAAPRFASHDDARHVLRAAVGIV